MLFVPIAFGLMAALMFGLCDYLVAKPTRGIGQFRTTIYVLLFSTLTLLPFLIFNGVSTYKASLLILALAVLSSFGTLLGYLFAFKAYRYGNLSINAPIFGAYPIIILLAAVFLLGYTISDIEIALIVVTIIGILLVSTKFSALRSRKGSITAAGTGSATMGMLITGAQYTFAGVYSSDIGYTLLATLWRGISLLIGFAGGGVAKQDLRVPAKQYL
jgi:uncharacterized membrane protein